MGNVFEAPMGSYVMPLTAREVHLVISALLVGKLATSLMTAIRGANSHTQKNHERNEK